MKGLMVVLMSVLATGAVAGGEWVRLTPLPDKEGFAGMFAGVSGGALVAAGGANFPGKKPWEGGTKVWYDTVYVLEKPDGQWKVAGRLPRALGYGVSVTYGGGVVCVGGSDARGHSADVFRLEWKEGKVVVTPLPALPKAVANACGAVVDGTLFVAGGIESPEATETSRAVYRMELGNAAPRWVEMGGIPGGGRMLSVAGASGGQFWVIGGTDLVVGKDGKLERRYLRDAYHFGRKSLWQRAADLPWAVVAAPSPAPAPAPRPGEAARVYVVGGDDGSQVGIGAEAHKGFGRRLVSNDGATGKWLDAGEIPAGAPAAVTAPCVDWNGMWVVVSGEVRPGVRTPGVWGWRGE